MRPLQIETTQHVRLAYQPASVGDRILAYLLDSLLLGAWIIGVVLLMSSLGGATNLGQAWTVLLMALIGVPLLLYHLVSELYFNGQSVGKRVLGIRVVLLDGRAPGLGAYLLRWVFRLVDILLTNGLLAVVMVAVNGRGQRLGDVAAGTAVVKLQAPIQLDSILTETPDDSRKGVQFPAAAQLSDRDIATVRLALRKGLHTGNPALIEAAAARVKEVTGIQTSLPDVDFLQTLLRDHTTLATQV
jgi:uncharacterized RDD family membrane protein YckC